MRIGVTGGAGFIGSWVREVAVKRGHEAICFDHLGRGDDGYRFLGDVRDPVAMTELAAHVDGIIHLAACLGTQETIKNPRPAAETNMVGGLNFLEACAQYSIPGVYIGVGNHWMNNTYSISKTTIERFTRMFNAERGTRVNVVRLVNAYGPRQSVAPPFGPAKVRKILPSFICRALTGTPIEIYGDGLQVSDMVYVEDGAYALVRALELADKGRVWDRACEVGPQLHKSVVEIALEVRNAAEALGYKRARIEYLPMRPGEIPGASVTANTDTLSLVGLSPQILKPVEQGIPETVQWFAENWLPGYLAGKR